MYIFIYINIISVDSELLTEISLLEARQVFVSYSLVCCFLGWQRLFFTYFTTSDFEHYYAQRIFRPIPLHTTGSSI